MATSSWFQQNAYPQNPAARAQQQNQAGPVQTQPRSGGGGDLQATTAPSSYHSGPVDPRVAQLVSEYIQQSGITANQSDPSSLRKIVEHLRSQGVDAQVDYTDSNGHTGGILVGGQPYQLIDGSNRWTDLKPWNTSGGSGSAAGIMEQDPGYQFRLEEGAKALQRSAAAKGTLLTGGTQKALARYAQNYAAGEFGSVFNRNLSLAQLGQRSAAEQSDTAMGIGNAQGGEAIARGNTNAGWVDTVGDLASFYYGRGRTPASSGGGYGPDNSYPGPVDPRSSGGGTFGSGPQYDANGRMTGVWN